MAKYMASTDEIFITVKGKGGHGGYSAQNIDPVLIASHLVVALHQASLAETKSGHANSLIFWTNYWSRANQHCP
ncbi:MAG: peptidase dimerization domain-containing protein [Bacteroidales bacterium]